FLVERAEFAESSGIDPARICVDPGIGFGKSFEHNLDLLSGLDRLVEIGKPVLLGTSRKRFLGQILGEDDPLQRDIATSATLSLAISQGVSVLRVHNVAMALQTARVADAIVRA
ncbi:MAG: dihydropteroate synthase, partial [Acidimicrobiia bacterium]|nr:dihydropteroate synthase [Acidimicrobiia bacterium]